ncbi:CARDB domain-containing protein [Thermococcus sp. SY098]|uniref:CARDB domain-containing protein n=1 Tax=Thermococcus sp. SY098 TaxID=3111325 RepID=UPI002D77999D|nr:CARDB domain-containing protein [Thermococcus sp. SY098]WRS52051.1 CARDB domain-containing protein [Thermococcus sp. SY098]
MRRTLSIILITLILGLSFSAAVNQSFVLASTQDDKAYEDFWNILNKEAELIVELNSSTDANEIQSLALQLIQNSQNGSSNAAQISALIWQSLEELKNSGVKTYYTAEELRQMAQNISQNGLPQETVQVLKEQGWSDNEIQALQEYIARNADSINEDFNLTKFLKDFSQAFIQVAFKYNHYEAWAIEKWKWKNPEDGIASQGEAMINPLLADEWIDFYKAYYNGTLEEQLTSLNKLQSKVYSLITGSLADKEESLILSPKPIHQPVEESTTSILLPIKTSQVKNIKYLTDDALEFETWEFIGQKSENKEGCTYLYNKYNVTHYYWESPLKAYKLVREIHSLLLAKQFGNKDIELEWQLNEKISKLKDALIVIHEENTITLVPVSKSCTYPIVKLPKLPASPVLTSTSTPVTSIEDMTQEQTVQLDELALRALSIGDETELQVAGEIIVESVTPSEVEYKVKVTVKAENAQATNINIYIDGNKEYGPFDLGAGESRAITLPVGSYFTEDIPSNAQEITLSKTIKVTYTKWCNNINSVPGGEEVLSAPAGCGEEAMVIKTVSKTIQLFDAQVSVSKAIVKVNEPVEFTFTITNYMTSSKTFNLLVTAGGKSKEDTLTVPAGETKTKTLQLTFNTPGERTYYAKVDGTTYAVGTIKVEDDDSSTDSGNLTIESVELYPNPPRVGDTAEFRVKVKNTYSSSKSFTLKLKVNGSEVYSESVSLNGGKSATFKLYWTPEKVGRYVWGIMISVSWGTASYREGTVNVVSANAQFGVSLEAMPVELVGGGTVYFTVKVLNYVNSAYSIRGYVVGKDGNKVYPEDGEYFEARLPAGGNYTAYFDLPVSGIGNHTYMLYVDNYGGESHTDSVKIEVKQGNGELQQVYFVCNDLEFNWNGLEYKAKLTCKAGLYNPTDQSIEINVISIKNWDVDNYALRESIDNPWIVSYSNIINPHAAYEVIFKNTARTTFTTLERDLLGTYSLISMNYIISPKEGSDIEFTGSDIINIQQDTKDVIADASTNTILTYIGIKELVVTIRSGNALRNLWPLAVQLFRKAWGWLND